MWGGEKIENEIERLVKILTKCKMKLKSRRKEKQSRAAITCPTIIPPGRGQSPAPVPLSSLYHSILSSSTRLTSPRPAAPSLSAATDRKAIAPAISLPAVPPSPFLLHKLPKQQSVAVVTWRSTQLAGPAVAGAQLARRPVHSRWPLVLHRFRFLPSLGAAVLGERNYRKTKA